MWTSRKNVIREETRRNKLRKKRAEEAGTWEGKFKKKISMPCLFHASFHACASQP